MDGYNIGRVEPHQLEEVHRLYMDIGWDFKLDYVSMLYNLQPQAWHCATTTDGRIVGVCLYWILDEQHARFGKFVTHPDHRGEGIGKALINTGLEYVKGRNAGIAAISNYKPMFEKLGFSLSSMEVVNFKGRPLCNTTRHEPRNMEIIDCKNVNFDKLLEYDISIHIIKREALLKCRISGEMFQTLVVLGQDRDIVGYGAIWKTDKNYRINPLYADNPEVAKLLLVKFLSKVPDDQAIRVQTYLHPDAIHLWENIFGLTTDKRSADIGNTQMFTKSEVPVKTNKVYSLFDSDASFT